MDKIAGCPSRRRLFADSFRRFLFDIKSYLCMQYLSVNWKSEGYHRELKELMIYSLGFVLLASLLCIQT